jgi:hypothetical protein
MSPTLNPDITGFGAEAIDGSIGKSMRRRTTWD